MKKFVCLLLAVSFILCLVACKEDNVKTDSVDISYYANLGQIPECDYKLGQSALEVAEELKAKAEKEDASEEDFCEVIEGETVTKIITSDTHYIYKNDETEISKIVVFNTVYGFDLGTDLEKIKKSQEAYDKTGEEVSLSEEEARDFSGNEYCTYLKFDFEKSTVIFAFEDNALFGAEIKSK